MRADVTTTAAAGVTLVRVALRNTVAVALRVRIRNELGGPVLPPRREGVPEAGWDADGFTGVVPAEGRLGVGYACPIAAETARASADEAREHDRDSGVVTVDIAGPATDDGGWAPATDDPVASAVRALGRACPPADAIPTEPDTIGSNESDATGSDELGATVSSHSDHARSATAPRAVAAWADAVEARIERAERLTDASAAEAAAMLEACGGIDSLESVPDTLAADATALRAASKRIGTLADRAEAADPAPVVSALAAAAAGERVDIDTETPEWPEER
ncbi:DUF7857 domain-containing protein [Halobellus sp. GM3]|uniref:DUF7857 domain-containing protein n=1 Tax=Halobellus sp. GM3 TaxID=3458410 RepID=UPI00403D8304